MRRLVCGLLGTALLVGQAQAADKCATQTEREIFDLAALKSEMMVLATSCHEPDRYNAVIEKFKPELLANERLFDAYFKRTYGRSGQAEHDTYITSLANAQSDEGLKQGTDFCPHTTAIFDEALAVPSGKDLFEYAEAKDLVPDSLGVCVEPTRVVRPTRAPARHTVKR
jgi:hypothetical protein